MPEPVVCLDYAASTPLRPEAREAMDRFHGADFGNPSGVHAVARAAKTALEEARERVAAALGALPGDVVFTAGGTEADNLAVKGAARAAREGGGGDGVVVTAFEHKGVLAPAERLAREGFRVSTAAVTADGVVDLDALVAHLDDRTAVVSVMAVNNEVGTVQPLAEVAAAVRARSPRAVLHTDAVQAVPWLDVDALVAPMDLVSISAHKFGGPKGVGALVVREGVALEPLVEGGGQERGRRSGTSNVAGVVAMAAALDATVRERSATVARVTALRDRLVAELRAAIPDLEVNGDPARKVAGNAHVAIPGVDAETLLVALDQAGVAAAAGSSCSSGATEPSHVLLAMGMARSRALASIRLTLGFPSTAADVDRAVPVIVAAATRLRASAVA